MFFDTSDLQDGEIQLKCTGKLPAQVEKGYVPTYAFEICLVNGLHVGTCDLRIGNNGNTYYGGHIGYGVDRQYRGRHYAEKACRLLFILAKKHGMDHLFITCEPENIASSRTCERAGGAFQETAEIPSDHEMYAHGKRKVKIYRVDLKE